MSIIVTVAGAKKNYVLGKTVVQALRGVDLEVSSGEFLALSGPSGSGKTTLLNLIGCIEQPSSGSVFIDGNDVGALSSDQAAHLRAEKIGFIFQNFNLLPVLTAAENVEYPLLIQKADKKTRRRRAEEALAKVGLAGHMNHKPLEMSGGQRQRVAIARAIVGNPLLVLADEPTANLDHENGDAILDLMKSMNQSSGTTFIFSTHDPKIVSRASRVVKLFDGRIASASS